MTKSFLKKYNGSLEDSEIIKIKFSKNKQIVFCIDIQPGVLFLNEPSVIQQIVDSIYDSIFTRTDDSVDVPRIYSLLSGIKDSITRETTGAIRWSYTVKI